MSLAVSSSQSESSSWLSRFTSERDLRPLVSFLVLLIAWQLASVYQLIDPRFLPAPQKVVLRGYAELVHGNLLLDIRESLRRNLTGFALGGSVALILGITIGASSLMTKLIGPTLVAKRQIALFSWVPLLSLWFGGDDTGKIAFISVAAFQPIVINTWNGVRNVPASYEELAQVLVFNRLEYALLVAVPAALPAIFTGLQTGLIYGWLATVGSEVFLNISPGLGGRLSEGSQLFDLELLFVAIFFLGTIGMIYSRLVTWAETRFIHWRSL